MDVLCQIGLDGIRMLDPSTSRTLRIYPLETVTRFEVFDLSTFAFWSKSSVDIEPRRIRLQSNSYTTNTILDIACATDFNAFVRRHHCRNCGDIFCDKCTHGRIALTADENAQRVRVCDRCMVEVTQRLSNAKEAASKSVGLQSHEDLAKKLQEEMERNRKPSSGFRSDGSSGRRMKEVACPTCTVHLQVQVPSSGSETIECGVCQHPFLVTAN